MLEQPVEDTKLVVLHLGNGASAAAISGGRSIDTSMGLTPLAGLVMGTRSGDIDPGVFSFMVRNGMTASDVDAALNRESGLKGLSGTNDFREVDQLVAENDPDGRLAFDVTAYRLRKYIGAYAVALGRLDAVVFTAGIGEHAPRLRAAVCHDLGILGVELDEEANLAAGGGERRISTEASATAVLVIPDQRGARDRDTGCCARGRRLARARHVRTGQIILRDCWGWCGDVSRPCG